MGGVSLESKAKHKNYSVIGKYVRNVFKEGELAKDSVWAKFACTAADGKDYNVDYSKFCLTRSYKS